MFAPTPNSASYLVDSSPSAYTTIYRVLKKNITHASAFLLKKKENELWKQRRLLDRNRKRAGLKTSINFITKIQDRWILNTDNLEKLRKNSS